MSFKDRFIQFQNLHVNNTIALRQVIPERDLGAYFEIYVDSDAFEYYSGYNHPPKDIESMAAILNNQIKSFQRGTEYNWTITERESDVAIGRILFSDFQCGNTAANIGYFLKRDHWRQGIISACITPVVR
jgi:ribosomal-protein-alanine N-acetyltransferase